MDEETPLRRGMVLLALHAQWPMALMEAALRRQVLALFGGERRALTRAVAYLEARGLLITTTDTVGGRTLRSFKITPDGIDVVDGSTELSGVVIERYAD